MTPAPTQSLKKLYAAMGKNELLEVLFPKNEVLTPVILADKILDLFEHCPSEWRARDGEYDRIYFGGFYLNPRLQFGDFKIGNFRQRRLIRKQMVNTCLRTAVKMMGQ